MTLFGLRHRLLALRCLRGGDRLWARPRPLRCVILMLLCVVTGLAQMPSVALVTNAADYSFTVAPGMIATIFGTALAPSQKSASGVPLPTTLNGVSVTVNGVSAPLFYVSPVQINFQVPYETPNGTSAIQVEVLGEPASNAYQVPVALSSVGIFQYGSDRGVVQNQDYTLNAPTNPAAAGSVVMVYLTGIGATVPPVADGAVAPPSNFAVPVATATATIGDANAPLQFFGLTPGTVGLAQANILVPALPDGDYPLIITLNGHQSTSVLISVSGSGTGFTVSGLLGLVSSVTVPNGVGVAEVAGLDGLSLGVPVLLGNDLYICGPPRISVVDVSNPTSPLFVTEFGDQDLNGQGQGCVLNTSATVPFLVAASTTPTSTPEISLITYDLTNPAEPVRRSEIQNAGFPQTFNGNFAYADDGIYNLDTNLDVTSYTGHFNVIDFTNVSSPSQSAVTVLSNQATVAMLSPSSAILYQLTNINGNSGVGAINIYDTTTQDFPMVVGQITVPGTTLLNALAASGTELLVAGSTQGLLSPGYYLPNGKEDSPETGYLTLTTYDTSDPKQPVMQGFAINSLRPNFSGSPNFSSGMVSLGGGFFALSCGAPDLEGTGPGVNNSLVIIDARVPSAPQAYTYAVVQGLGGLWVANGYLYAATAAGANIYKIQLP
jgi:uncharacterized protein (TIGR03437 family)